MLEVNDIREKTLKSKKKEIDRLLSRKYPVFLMGINETTDQVIALLNKYEITIEGILDDFSKEKKYKGIEIFSSDEIMMQKTTAIILLAVNVRPKTAEYNLRQKGFRYLLHSFELFLYDNIENIVLPFWQNGYNDFKLNKEKYFWLYSNLSDDMSKKVLVDTLNFRINANLSVMKDYDININNQYFEEFLNFSKRESFVDCGGYDGETTKRFIELNPLYEKIFYFEPIKSFFELSKQKLNSFKNIVFFQKANYKENKILSFNIRVILKLCGMRKKRVEKEIKMAYPKPNQ